MFFSFFPPFAWFTCSPLLFFLLASHHITVPSFINGSSGRHSVAYHRADALFLCALFLHVSSLFLLGPVLSDTSYLLPTQYSACGISTAVLSVFLLSSSHIRTSRLAFPAPHRIGICCTVQCFNAYCICIISRFKKYFCYHAIYVPCSVLRA